MFACYTPPDHIVIMNEPIRKAALSVSQVAPGLVELFRQDDIMNTILGHEIFHTVEERFESEISGAESIYRDVLGVGSGRCREAVEDHE